jgi:hypothetical protein
VILKINLSLFCHLRVRLVLLALSGKAYCARVSTKHLGLKYYKLRNWFFPQTPWFLNFGIKFDYFPASTYPIYVLLFKILYNKQTCLLKKTKHCQQNIIIFTQQPSDKATTDEYLFCFFITNKKMVRPLCLG